MLRDEWPELFKDVSAMKDKKKKHWGLFQIKGDCRDVATEWNA